MNIIERLNGAIEAFVLRPENAALRPATGSYSTPFRGHLFGHEIATKVADELLRRPAALLFLGSNPNSPSSLELLRGQDGGDGHWPEFQRQQQSGYFGERVVDATGAVRVWDPLHNATSMGQGQHFWTLYAQAFRNAGIHMEEAAMANIFSWGSNDLNALVTHLLTHDSGMLNRVVDFANHQLEVMLAALRPQLLVCPRSAANHKRLSSLLASLERAHNLVDLSPTGLEGRAFPIHAGTVAVNGALQQTLFLSHPSALRGRSTRDTSRIRDAISEAVRTARGER